MGPCCISPEAEWLSILIFTYVQGKTLFSFKGWGCSSENETKKLWIESPKWKTLNRLSQNQLIKVQRRKSSDKSSNQYSVPPLPSKKKKRKKTTDSGWIGIGQTEEKDNLWPSQVRYHDPILPASCEWVGKKEVWRVASRRDNKQQK